METKESAPTLLIVDVSNGTLSQNRMTVVHMWFGNKIVVGVLKHEVNGDASEAAILKCIKLGEEAESPKLGKETESPKMGEETES